MIIRLQAEVVEEETGQPALGFHREEVFVIDIDEENAQSAAYIEAGAALMDWLQDAQRSLGAQISRSASAVEWLKRKEGGE